MHIIGELLALTYGLFFAISNVLNKRGMNHLDTDAGLVITVAVNFLLNSIGFFLFWVTGNAGTLDYRALPWMILAGFLTTFLGRYFFLECIRLTGPSVATSFRVASPIYTVVISFLFLDERMSWISLVGTAAVLCGLWVITWTSNSTNKGQGPEQAGYQLPKLGILLGIGTGVTASAGMISRKLGMAYWPSALGGAFIGSAVALILIALFFTVRRKHLPWKRMLSRESTDYVWSGVSTTLAVITFFYALKMIGVGVANVLASIEPLFTVLFAYFLLRAQERITTGLIGGMFLIILGIGAIFVS